MTDIAARLNNLKAQIEKGKAERAKAEANLETYTKQKEEIMAELAALGVAPEKLDEEIARLEAEIESNLAKAEELLRG
jgi:chromosome segregation ATPase